MDITGDVTVSISRGLISRGTAVVAVGVTGLGQIAAGVILVRPDIRAIEIGVGRGIGVAGDVTVGISVGLIGRYPGGRAIGVGRFSQITAGVVMVR